MLKLKVVSFILICIIFVSCDSKTPQSEDLVKPDINLTTDQSLDSAQRIGWKKFYVRQYEKDGERYTGKQTYYYEGNNGNKVPYLIRSFENGLLQKEVAFRKNGKEIGRTEYEYSGTEVVKVTSFFANGSKKSETLRPSFAGDSLGMIKEWHENGQLKFLVKVDKNNNYSDQITLRDEEGNIVKQSEY